MKKALVFGVTGQDGSYLAEHLLNNDYIVTGVARRVSVDTTSRISHLLHSIRLAEGDITDQFCVSNIIHTERPDEIYNLAAQSHVGTSFKQPSTTWQITAGGCLNILESMRTLNLFPTTKFYQASSSEMFGRNFDTEGNLKYQDENTVFKPQSPYAIAKVAAHMLVDNYRQSYGLFGCCGILFNHESERRGENFVTRKITKWIGEFVRWRGDNNIVFRKNEIYIPKIGDLKNSPTFPKLRLGNLEAFRDWGYAGDYVDAMWRMLQQQTPDDYVVCTGETHSIREFLDLAFGEIGIQTWEDYVVQDPKFYRPAEVDHLLGISEKARVVLGWEPKIEFRELVSRMVENDINEAELRRSRVQAV